MKPNLSKLIDPKMRKPLGISLLLHLVILLISYLALIPVTIDLPEFVEISFVQAGQAAAKISQPSKPAAKETITQPTPEQPMNQEDQVVVEEELQLPKRRMLETEPPNLRVRSSEKRSPSRNVSTVTPEKAAKELARDSFAPTGIENRKEDFQPGDIPGEAASLAESSSKKGVSESSFEIEGKAAERKIQSQMLPSYPKSYSIEGVIKFGFKVLPNGHVAEIIPIMKSDAILEDNAMSALTQWRFNPLPRNVPQEAVEGTITFRYKLK